MLIAKKKKIIFGLSLGLACAVGAGALVGVYFLASSNSNKKANNLDNKKVNKKDSTNNNSDNKNINSGNETKKITLLITKTKIVKLKILMKIAKLMTMIKSLNQKQSQSQL